MNHIDLQIYCRVSELIERLRENRAKHAAIVKEARAGYTKAAVQALRDRLRKLEEAGDEESVSLVFTLTPPLDYTDEYDVALEMLELHARCGNETIQLSSDDVRKFVRNRWDWQERFLSINSAYSALAASER